MPSVRFARDKRGYEYVYLVHVPTRKGRPGKSRVLYWYRTPPGVRIGRKPFDDEVRRTLEAQNPGLTFDWEAIVATPMPPPDMTEYWRERRRLEKAARLERMAEEALEAAASRTGTKEGDDSSLSANQRPRSAGNSDDVAALEGGGDESEVAEDEGDDEATSEQDVALDPSAAELAAGPRNSDELRRKRRRRGGRRKRGAPKAGEFAEPAEAGSIGQQGFEASATPAASGGHGTYEVAAGATGASGPAPDSQIVLPSGSETSASEE